MSDIYTHDPVQDFTNPFLDFDQGYVRPFTTILPIVRATLVPIASKEEEKSVLPKKPLTRKELKTRRAILGVRVRENLRVRFFFLLS